MLIYRGVQGSFGKRLLQVVEQGVCYKGRFRVGSRQKLMLHILLAARMENRTDCHAAGFVVIVVGLFALGGLRFGYPIYRLIISAWHACATPREASMQQGRSESISWSKL